MTRWSQLLTATLFVACNQLTLAQTAIPFNTEVVADFHEPWAMAFLPDGQLLVTEKKGSLKLVSQSGEMITDVSGVPDVDYGGQGGLGDVAIHPNFPDQPWVYLSYAESGPGNTRGAAIARGRLDTSGRRPSLEGVEVIWRQYPKVVGRGHFAHRLRFDSDGLLWVSSGDRQKFTPAQDMQSNMGKILRLNDDGSIPAGNPFSDYLNTNPLVDDEGVYAEIWSLGHRNPLGIDFDAEGNLWEIEMGPAGGDELNLIRRGANYGYPEVSNGDHYDGRPIPQHSTRPEFQAPALSWTPVISPGDLCIYRGDLFADWQGDALIAGLSSKAIVRVRLGMDEASEIARYDMKARIRSVREAPDGSVWVLEDERRGSQGRLLKLVPDTEGN